MRGAPRRNLFEALHCNLTRFTVRMHEEPRRAVGEPESLNDPPEAHTIGTPEVSIVWRPKPGLIACSSLSLPRRESHRHKRMRRHNRFVEVDRPRVFDGVRELCDGQLITRQKLILLGPALLLASGWPQINRHHFADVNHKTTHIT